ncbi:MAG TPA: hypothetical protein DE179_12530 [Oceanospirillaceae bacterium]|nr:hypothetical protein [Oceanospirillaceae bacterium]
MLSDLEMLAGDLPKKAENFVMQWATANRDALLKMWDTQAFSKPQPLC